MQRRLQQIIYMLLLVALTSCGTADIQVWSMSPAEATDQAISTQSALIGQQQGQRLVYTNNDYGFTFSYPRDWTLNESRNFVTLVKDGVHLNIGFKGTQEDVEILATGMPAGEIVADKENPIRFIGQDITKELIVLDDKVQVVMYGTGLHEFANRVFYLRADAIEPEASQRGISPVLQKEMDAIVESMELPWLAISLPDTEMEDWLTFEDEKFPFTLRYPDTWELKSTPSYVVVDNTEIVVSQNVTLIRDNYAIMINSRSAESEAQLEPDGLIAGELQKGYPFGVLIDGQVVNRVHAIYDDNIIFVIYAGDEGVGNPVMIENYEFAVSLSRYIEMDERLSGYDVPDDLPDDVRAEADTILATLSVVDKPAE